MLFKRNIFKSSEGNASKSVSESAGVREMVTFCKDAKVTLCINIGIEVRLENS